MTRIVLYSDQPILAQGLRSVLSGVPGYEVVSWNGVFARAGTPENIIAILNGSIRQVVAIPEVKERYGELGIEAKASSPEELKSRLQADIAKWAAVIERAGIPKQ